MDAKKPENGWRHPLWERQPGESSKAFTAFTKYRDQGPQRSGSQVADGLVKSGSLINRWCGEWGWVERAEAWDDESDRLTRERDQVERNEMRRKMLDTHARGGMKLYAIAEKALAKYDLANPETAEAAKERIDAMHALEAARLMDVGAKMERLARGETQERIDTREAMAWIGGFIDLALVFIPKDAQDSFLAEVDARLGASDQA